MIRAKIARLLPAGSFARNVSLLTGGTAFAQGLAVLALPLLTRLYSPEDFSLLAVYMAIIGIVTVVSCLRYNIAIPLPKDDANGMALLAVSLATATGVSILLALSVFFFPLQIAEFLHQPALASYLWMVPLGVFMASLYSALQYWASRKQRFALITRTRISRATGGIGSQVAIGLVVASPFGLIFGHMLYGGLGVIGLARNLWFRDRLTISQLSPTQIIGQCTTYRRFPIWSVPEALFNTASVQLPIILIAAVAVGPEAGYLMLSMRVIGLPMGLVGSSVAQVFLAEAPIRLREGTLAEFTRNTMWQLFRIGGPPLVALGVLSPLLLPLAFGTEWARASWMVLLMTPWFVLQFVASPVSMVLHVTGQVLMATALQAFGFILRVGSVLIVISFSPTWATEAYIFTGALYYVVYILAVLSVLKAKR